MHAGILVFDGADELDVAGPYRVLAATTGVAPYAGNEPIEVHLVAEAMRTIRLGNGMRVEPDHTFETSPALDVLVVPGGSSDAAEGRRAQQRNETVKAFIATRAKDARVTASVCTGAFLLAEAGVLAGRRGNTHWRFRDELAELMRERGEAFDLVHERVVWDGDLVSGGGVTSGIDVALSIIEKLCGETAAKTVRRALELETPA